MKKGQFIVNTIKWFRGKVHCFAVWILTLVSYFRIPPNIENCDSVQKSLAKLFQNWTKTQNKHNFQIVRASKDIKEIEQSLKKKSSLSKLSGNFVPIHVSILHFFHICGTHFSNKS